MKPPIRFAMRGFLALGLVLLAVVSGCVVTTTETTSKTIGLEPGGKVVKGRQ